MELSPALLGLVGGVLAAIIALIGGLVGVLYNRLDRVEKKEAACQGQLFQLRTDMQTMWLALELILQKYPAAGVEVRDAIRQMRERQEAFLHEDGEPAADGA